MEIKLGNVLIEEMERENIRMELQKKSDEHNIHEFLNNEQYVCPLIFIHRTVALCVSRYIHFISIYIRTPTADIQNV